MSCLSQKKWDLCTMFAFCILFVVRESTIANSFLETGPISGMNRIGGNLVTGNRKQPVLVFNLSTLNAQDHYVGGSPISLYQLIDTFDMLLVKCLSYQGPWLSSFL